MAVYSQGNLLPLKQMQRGASPGLIPITNGPGNMMIFADPDTIITATLDTICCAGDPILRNHDVGSVIPYNDPVEWINWHYKGNYTQPVIQYNGEGLIYEVGTTNSIELSGYTTNPCGYTLSSGSIGAPVSYSFGSASTFSTFWTNAPTTAGDVAPVVSQNWTMTTTVCDAGSPNSGTATNSKIIRNRHPVLYGMSATAYTGGSVPYSGWTKFVNIEQDYGGLTMTGTNMYIYIFIPKSWSDYDLYKIYDHNDFDVTASFTPVDVSITSTGLTNNWTQNYKGYKLTNLTTAAGYNYRFVRNP